MKKILLFASAIALMTSCAQDEFGIDERPISKQQGVSFQATIDDIDTRAEWTKEGENWKMFWYAEQDKMDFYVKDGKVGSGNKIASWDATNGKAIYKASRSLGEGYFVADDNTKIIGFTKTSDKWDTPSFRYVWPTGTTVTLATNELVATLPAIKAQDQTDLSGSSTIKYAFMAGKMDEVAVPADYASGSDVLIGMKLNRKMPLAVFNIKNYNKSVYGKLMSITLTSEGEVKADKTVDDTKKENIDYGSDATWNLETDKFTVGNTNLANVVKLTFNSTNGIEWSDDATAFMTINAIDRSKATLSSKYSIKYEFENATFTDEFTTKANWAGGQIIRMSGTTSEPAYDLEKQPYTLIGKTTNYTLLINESFEGKVADIMTATGVKMPNSQSEVTFANIKNLKASQIVSDPTSFAKLTALETATLSKQTELVKDMFDATTLKKISANKATKVDVNFNKATTATYTDVELASYDFAASDVKDKLITSTLVNADISSVPVIAPAFPSEGITFTQLTNLKTIKVGANVVIGSNAFNGCTSLTDVIFPEGASAKSIGTSAFNGCAALKTITIPGTEVSAAAFKGCTTLKIANIKDFKPVTIGADAFSGCEEITDMNLSAATTIGEGAFKDCTKLVGNKVGVASGVSVLKVPALTKLEDNTFSGCTALKYIEFNEVTSVGVDFLKDCTLNEIKFGKVFTVHSKTASADESFGTIANTKLFVQYAQKAINGNKLTLKGTASGSVDKEYTFQSIVQL